MQTETAEVTWEKCLSIIKDNISYQKYKSWFEPIRAISLSENTLTIQVLVNFGTDGSKNITTLCYGRPYLK